MSSQESSFDISSPAEEVAGAGAGSALSPTAGARVTHPPHTPYQRNDEWLSYSGSLAARVVAQILTGHVPEVRPATVLDAACRWGLLVEALRKRGVQAHGIDPSPDAIRHVRAEHQAACRVASPAEPLAQHYDLIICLDGLEQYPPPEGEAAVANLCAHSDDILFASPPADFGRAASQNSRPGEYWAGLFAQQGFFRDVDFDASFISPWAVRYRRSQEPLPSIVRAYERAFGSLWQENTRLRLAFQGLRDRLEQKETQLEEQRRRLLELENRAQAARVELHNLQSSPAWQTAQQIQRVAPPGSWRARLLRWIGIK